MHAVSMRRTRRGSSACPTTTCRALERPSPIQTLPASLSSRSRAKRASSVPRQRLSAPRGQALPRAQRAVNGRRGADRYRPDRAVCSRCAATAPARRRRATSRDLCASGCADPRQGAVWWRLSRFGRAGGRRGDADHQAGTAAAPPMAAIPLLRASPWRRCRSCATRKGRTRGASAAIFRSEMERIVGRRQSRFRRARQGPAERDRSSTTRRIPARPSICA